MSSRPFAATLLVFAVAACGSSAASGPPSTSGTIPGGTAAPGQTDAGATAGTTVDLSDVDVCALVPMAVVEGLTGETGFEPDLGQGQDCFWAVGRPGVPQYVEVRAFSRAGGLSGYSFSPGGGCTSAPVAGIGSEAFGGTCTDPQRKVFLVAWDRGVAVQVLVNEPKGALTPADLGAVVGAVLAGIPLV